MRPLLFTCVIALLVLSAFTKKKNKPKLPDEFVYVPGGTYSIAPHDEPFDVNKHRKSIRGFYMSKYEITNLQYKQFLAEMKNALPTDEFSKLYCDTSRWDRAPLAYCAPMSSRSYAYHRHPVFKDYPVLNVNHDAIKKYCEWLQTKLIKDNPNYTIEVQLPAKDEWTYAAMGGRRLAIYPWSNYYLQNNKGEFLCNYKQVGDVAISRNKETGFPQVTNDPSTNNGGPMLAKSFTANGFGLYNMCGNVAEMIAEPGICMGGSWDDYGGDVTTRSEAKYDVADPTVGFRPIIFASEKK